MRYCLLLILTAVFAGCTVDQAIAGAKAAMEVGTQNTMLSFMDTYFTLYGYINEVRGKKRVALINIGRLNGVKPGDTYRALEIEKATNFATGEAICRYKQDHTHFTVSPDYLANDHAWIEEDSIGISFMERTFKIGTPVKRIKPGISNSRPRKLWTPASPRRNTGPWSTSGQIPSALRR